MSVETKSVNTRRDADDVILSSSLIVQNQDEILSALCSVDTFYIRALSSI